MMEVWARGNNVWRQLEFSPSSSSDAATGDGRSSKQAKRLGEEEEEEVEPRDLDVYGKVFEAERVEWVRGDGFGCVGMLGVFLFVRGLGGAITFSLL
jgi:hypothetical protein